MSKHTPEPWVFVPGDDNLPEEPGFEGYTAGSIMADGYHLARVWNDAPNPEADGRLMAAAPELLAALEIAVGAHPEAPWAEAARGAIASARGEEVEPMGGEGG
ncbi:MAG: hypothetical protein AB1578_20635 [Thermodesulfobacteriota bacterium]|jgi:hypothetical protein